MADVVYANLTHSGPDCTGPSDPQAARACYASTRPSRVASGAGSIPIWLCSVH